MIAVDAKLMISKIQTFLQHCFLLNVHIMPNLFYRAMERKMSSSGILNVVASVTSVFDRAMKSRALHADLCTVYEIVAVF